MIQASRLARDWKLDARRTLTDLTEGLRHGHIKPQEFSLRDLAAHLIEAAGTPIGYDGLRLMEGRSEHLRLMEAAGAITTSAFRLVTQRIVDAAVLEGARLPDTVLSQVLPVVEGRKRRTEMPSPTIPLQDGKSVGDIQESQEYPILGIYGERVRNLPVRKKGFQLPITREAVLEDDTGALLQAARDAGAAIARAKEDLICDMVAGLVANCVIEQRAGETSETVSDLFLTSGRWVNSHVNALADWTDLDDAVNLLIGNTITGTGGPAVLLQRHLLVPEQRRSLAYRILNAIETRSGSGSNTVIAGNPYSGQGGTPGVNLLVSPHLYARQIAAGVSAANAIGTWYFGDLTQAWRYYQLWPIEVNEDPTPSQRFTHDIWVRYQVSECGVPVCVQPRVWSRNLPA
jgi:hypothetical protein